MKAIIFKPFRQHPLWPHYCDVPEPPVRTMPATRKGNDFIYEAQLRSYQKDVQQAVASAIPFREEDRGKIMFIARPGYQAGISELRFSKGAPMWIPESNKPYPIEGLEVRIERCESCPDGYVWDSQGQTDQACPDCLGVGKFAVLMHE